MSTTSSGPAAAMATSSTLSFLAPQVPADADPFSTFHNFYDNLVWVDPSPGYRTRLGVLGALVILMALLALSLLAALAIFQRERFWLFRLVKREGGRYIVGNGLLIVPLFALALVPAFIGNFITDGDTYLAHGEQSSSDTWSVSVFPILFAGSWLWSCSGLQAFILAGGSRRMPVSAKLANFIFLGGLFVGVAAMSALAAVGANISSHKSWTFFKLDKFDDSRAATFNGTANADDLARLNQLATDYDVQVDRYQAVFIKLLYVFAATPFCIGFINLGTLALFFVVRRQVSDSRSTFHPFRFVSTVLQHEQSEAAPSPMSEIRSAPSRSDEDQAKRLHALEEVQTELLLSCIAHYFFILALFISTIWSATQFQDQGLTGWSRMEAISLLPTWICSVFFSCFLSVRLYRTIRSIRKNRGDRRAAQQVDPPPISAAPTFLQLPPGRAGSAAEKAEEGTEKRVECV